MEQPKAEHFFGFFPVGLYSFLLDVFKNIEACVDIQVCIVATILVMEILVSIEGLKMQ